MADESEVASAPGLWRRKRTWEPVLLVLLLAVLGVAGWRRWGPPAYVGTSEGVTLMWSCTNGIAWSASPGGAYWWAGQKPVAHGRLVTGPSPGTETGGIVEERATGRLHFDSRNGATFRSRAGGTLAFHRVPAGTFIETGCAIDPTFAEAAGS
ncbi:MAG TPA: hypothetical protein VID05_06515 [Acidimicrobiales bacterium]|jgi:hypothetical protein